jgi:hypothetical protein
VVCAGVLIFTTGDRGDATPQVPIARIAKKVERPGCRRELMMML